MKKIKNRYFLKNGSDKICETIVWALCGSESCLAYDDSRCVSIGETVTHPMTGMEVDMWFPLSTNNPAFDIASLCVYEYETIDEVDYDETSPTFMQSIPKQKPIRTISNNFDYYAQPLLSGYAEITKTQFNNPSYP